MSVISRLRGTSAFEAIRLTTGGTWVSSASAPVSPDSGLNELGRGSRWFDWTYGVEYWNERPASAPYWTPMNISSHPNMLFWHSNFRDGVGKALSDTAASLMLPSGWRVHGQGIAETDSGLVVTHGENGSFATLTTTDEDAHLVALTAGAIEGSNLPLQPDRNGPFVIDAEVRMNTALTLRSFFIGFLGSVPDALDPPVTGATTTLTLAQDDLAGLVFDAGLTANTTLCAVHNKSAEAATQTVAATTTGVAFPTAGTSKQFRVVINRLGEMRCYMDRVLLATVPAALDVDEEVAPVLLIRSTSTAVKSMDVLRITAWAPSS